MYGRVLHYPRPGVLTEKDMRLMRATSPSRLDSPRDISREALFASLGGGVLAIFGALGWQSAYGPWPVIVAATLAAALIVASGRLYFTVGGATQSGNEHVAERSRYLLMTRMEYIGFIVVLVGCRLLGKMNWALPLIVLIAGVHYLALGWLYNSPSAWVKGALLCVVALATVLFIPQLLPNQTDALGPVLLWWIIPGTVGAIILWADAARCLALARSQSM